MNKENATEEDCTKQAVDMSEEISITPRSRHIAPLNKKASPQLNVDRATGNGWINHVSDIPGEINITPRLGQIPPLNKNTPIGNKTEERVLNDICSILTEFQRQQQTRIGDDVSRTNWMLVALVIDRFLFVLFALLTVVTSCAILLHHHA